MNDRKIHYAGGVLYCSGPGRRGSTRMLPGWPACCSGSRAEKIAAAGEQSSDIARVTCARCLALWHRSREDHAELHAHRRDFEARVELRALRAVALTTLGQMIEPTEATLRVELASADRPEGGEREVVLTPQEALRLGRVLVAWALERGGDRA